ncbi:MAG TPA: TauD/TfdA family dioxygenase [Burkholderiales bacterium]
MNAETISPVDPRLLPPGPIAGPAAWYGSELAKRTDWIFSLDRTDLEEIDRAIKSFSASGAELAAISPESFPLPGLGPRLKTILHELLEGRGFVLMRGLEVERHSRAENAIAYMGIGSYFGRPRSQNAKGHLLGHVRDLGYSVTDPGVRYYQTSRKLDYHTDSVDIVGLLCLKTSKAGGESFLASSTTCYNEFAKRRPDLVARLFDAFPTDRRGEIPEGMKPWFDIPVFHWHEGRLSASFTSEYIASAQRNFPEARRLTPAHEEALELLSEIVNDPRVHLAMTFNPGDMQFLHNHQIFHSRNDFENWPEPERHRHLLRLWLCPANGRPLPKVFEPRYGSVTPGDRGGIVVKNMRPKVPLEPE